MSHFNLQPGARGIPTTILVGGPVLLSTLPLLQLGCGKGDRNANMDASATRSAQMEVIDDSDEDLSLPAIVRDPDDEAFHDPVEGQETGEDRDEKSTSTDGAHRGPSFTVKGVVKSVDPDARLVVVDQLLGDGRHHDVRFWTDDLTHVGWSKASMKMTLADLQTGIAVYVTYQVVGHGVKRRNRAIKIIIPGGMEDVAKMILGDPELGNSGQDKSAKHPKKH